MLADNKLTTDNGLCSRLANGCQRTGQCFAGEKPLRQQPLAESWKLKMRSFRAKLAQCWHASLTHPLFSFASPSVHLPTLQQHLPLSSLPSVYTAASLFILTLFLSPLLLTIYIYPQSFHFLHYLHYLSSYLSIYIFHPPPLTPFRYDCCFIFGRFLANVFSHFDSQSLDCCHSQLFCRS